jgi:hypothetical protein
MNSPSEAVLEAFCAILTRLEGADLEELRVRFDELGEDRAVIVAIEHEIGRRSPLEIT